MRKYVPKDNVQKKSYYTDRFWVAPRVPRENVENEHFVAVLEALGDLSKESYTELGQLVINIDATTVLKTMKILKEKCGYTQCSEQSAVDYLAKDGEFELFYQLLNITEAKRIRVICRIKEGEALQSVRCLICLVSKSIITLYLSVL